jgi:hypothetical protein
MSTATARKTAGKKYATAKGKQKKSQAGLIVSLVLAVGLAGGVWVITHPTQAEFGVGYPEQGRDHILTGQAHPAYNSFPPTSGWHDAREVPWGIHTEPQVQERLVHNLEHGGIVIQFRPDLDATSREALAQVARRFPRKVVMAPLPDLKVPIAVTAWTRLLELDSADAAKVQAFIERYKNKAPEIFPD